MIKIIFSKILNHFVYSIILFVSILFFAFALFRTSPEYVFYSNIGVGNVISDFFNWIVKIITSFDFGHTLDGRPVIDRTFYPVMHTIILTFSSLTLGLTVSLIVGWLWANNNKSKIVNFFVRSLNILSSIPLFLAAFVILLLVNYVTIDIYADKVKFIDKLVYYSVPVIVLTIFDGFLAEMINFIKIRIEEITAQQFITALELRGGSKFKHVMKHIFHQLLNIINSKFLNLIGGAIVVEIIFGWEGIGVLGINAVLTRDYSLFMGILTLTTVIILVFNLVLSTINYIISKKYQLIYNK